MRTVIHAAVHAAVFGIVAVDEVAAVGPTNLLVVVNKNSQDGLAVANHYRELRHVPHRNFVYVDYKGGEIECTWDEFRDSIHAPVLEHIDRLNLKDQVSVCATTPGLPYRVGGNSISAAFFFGEEHKPKKSEKLGPAGFEKMNPYFSSMEPWRTGAERFGGGLLHMKLTAGTLHDTLAMLRRSVSADATQPQPCVYLFDGDGPRGSRKVSIPQAKILLSLTGGVVEHRSGSQLRGGRGVTGLFTGAVNFPCAENDFAPGAIADHLTSFGGAFLDSRKQMPCTEFLLNGCSASYGTVVEPYNYVQKFPAAMLHVYYVMGFTAVESYWMSVFWPQQGLFAGDPLTRPFASPPQAVIESVDDKPVSGKTRFSVTAKTDGAGPGVSHVDLFIDGQYLTTVGQKTLPTGCEVSVRVADEKVTYTVKEDDRISDVLKGVGAVLRQRLDVDVFVRGDSLLVNRKVGEISNPSIEATSNASALFAEAVGGRFQAYQSVGKTDAGDRYEMAWLRFGAGPKEFSFSTDVDTTKLLDGRHRLRAVAYRGRASQSQSTDRHEFVVRNGQGKLTLSPVDASPDLGADEATLCTAEIDGFESATVHYAIDGRFAGESTKPPYALAVQPREWGRGPHEISASVYVDGMPAAVSDKFLRFEIGGRQ